MALIEIRTIPDPVLRRPADPVENISDEIIRLSDDMIETMILGHGAGLAANQVGHSIRLIAIDASLNPREKKHIILINPVIIESGPEVNGEEGCLSVPGYYEFIRRAKTVLARGADLAGNAVEFECEGQFARAMQHEIDHLDGKLFIDLLSPVKRGLFKKLYGRKDR